MKHYWRQVIPMMPGSVRREVSREERARSINAIPLGFMVVFAAARFIADELGWEQGPQWAPFIGILGGLATGLVVDLIQYFQGDERNT